MTTIYRVRRHPMDDLIDILAYFSNILLISIVAGIGFTLGVLAVLMLVAWVAT